MVPLPAVSSPVWLVLCWLAAWRLTVLLSYESGPFEVFSWLRLAFARVGLQRLIRCFHCMAFWVSAAIVFLVYELQPLSAILVFAVAGATSLTERLLGVTFSENEQEGHE